MSADTDTFDPERGLYIPGRRSFMALGLGAAFAAAFGVKTAPAQRLNFFPQVIPLSPALNQTGSFLEFGGRMFFFSRDTVYEVHPGALVEVPPRHAVMEHGLWEPTRSTLKQESPTA